MPAPRRRLRKKTVEQVAESREAGHTNPSREECFRTVFEQATDGFLVVDLKSQQFVLSNPRICQMLGYSADELRNLKISDIHPAKDLPWILELIAREAADEAGLASEVPVLRKDGSVFYADINPCPLVIGGQRCLLGIFRDVTHRKRTEDALMELNETLEQRVLERTQVLEQREMELKEAQRVAHIGNWTMDVDTGVVTWSEELYRIFGLDPSQPPPRLEHYSDVLTPESLARRSAAAEQTIQTGMPYELDLEIIRADGTRRWILTHGEVMERMEGRVVSLRGTAQDITERKRTEKAQQDSSELYASLVENLPQSIFRKDNKGRFVFCNKQFCKDVGRSLHEIVGKTDADFFPTELAASYRLDDLHVMQSGETMERVEQHVDTRGQTVFVQVVKIPLRDASGAIIGIQGIFWDITERREAEEALHRLNAELIHNDTNLKKAVQELQKAQEELRAAQLYLVETEKLQAVGRLAAGVAHEVKNPLAIMQLGMNYLSKGLPVKDGDIEIVLNDMMDAVRRADSVIHGLLDFSAPRKLETSVADLNAIVENSLRLEKHSFDRNHITVNKHLAPQPLRCRVDTQKIGAIFINLFENATHAMPSGGVLTVRTYKKQMTGFGPNVGDSKLDRFKAGQGVIVAEVLDSGAGIPADKIEKVFDPFFTTKPVGQGTGLGLSLCKTIMELHGGSIDIRNRPEGGAEVVVMLNDDEET